MLLSNDWGVIELDIASELYSIGPFGHVADEGLRDQNVPANKVLMLCQAQ